MHPLAPVLLLAGLSVLVVAGMLGAPHLLGPRRKTPVKQMTYESGMDPVGDAHARFDVQFYLVAIVFLVFDVELLFLYPWAVAAWHMPSDHDRVIGLVAAAQKGKSGSLNAVFVEVLIFIALLGLAYAYAWRKGVFRWR